MCSEAHQCLREHVCPSKTLIDYFQGGDTLDDFLRDFPTVKRDQARQAFNAAKDALA